MIHLDTSFLVDLLREAGRGRPGPATALLESKLDEDLWVSVYVVCELLAGAELSPRPSQERARVAKLISSLQVAYPDERFPPVYSRLLAWLERAGERIGTMDLLIAAAAAVDEAPLVTRNVRHFERIPGLELLAY